MAHQLTSRQIEILELIEQAVANTGFPPTRAEIAQELGFASANAAADHLRALEKKGYITMTPGVSRGIRLTATVNETTHEQGARPSEPGVIQTLLMPIIGRVAAGSPVLATENVLRELSVDPNLFDKRPDYLLEVRGQSMRDVGILDGDLLAVKKASDARSGEIVVARIDQDVTVKRLIKQKHQVLLEPANPDFEPIIVQESEQFAIEGIAVGLIRTGSLH
jgi:repressor LexA